MARRIGRKPYLWELKDSHKDMVMGQLEKLTAGQTAADSLKNGSLKSEGTEPEEARKAMELLEKLAEYKPLAKMEEQN